LAGLDGLYAGLLHPWTTPAPALATLALGILLAWAWPQGFLQCWLVFAAALLVGLVFGHWDAGERILRPALMLVATVTASFAALFPTQPRRAILLPGAGCGLLVGAMSVPDPGPLSATLATSAGSFVGANVALLYVSGGLGSARARFDRPWFRIGLRVVAAWTAAIGCLMFALSVAELRR
jgi:hypothetical protein